MTDRFALLRSIIEHPEEDLPRLIFADWCDENGESERAEFIRIQVQLSRSGSPGPLSIRIARLACLDFAEKPNPPAIIRAAELLQQHAPDWIGRSFFEVNIRSVDQEWGWSRGFLQNVTCTWAEWQRLAPKLLWWDKRKCDDCKGTGRDNMSYGERCDTCRGTGEIPGATVECSAIKWRVVEGTVSPETWRRRYGTGPCPNWCECRGSGRINAPFPADTAQPIERVTLTTPPIRSIRAAGGLGLREEIFAKEAEEHCRRLWPTVREWRFEGQQVDRYTFAMAELRRMVGAM